MLACLESLPGAVLLAVEGSDGFSTADYSGFSGFRIEGIFNRCTEPEQVTTARKLKSTENLTLHGNSVYDCFGFISGVSKFGSSGRVLIE